MKKHSVLWGVLSLSIFMIGSAANAEEIADKPRMNAPNTFAEAMGRAPERTKPGIPLLYEAVVGFDYDNLANNSLSDPRTQGILHNVYLELKESQRIFSESLRRDPLNSEIIWRQAMNNYDSGEELPEDDKEARMKLYDEVVQMNQDCMTRDPNNSGCVFWYGVGLGRRATTRGILASLFSLEDIEDNFLKATELPNSEVFPRGDSIHSWANYALGQFYRLAPDWWIVKVIAGTRGDREKSVEFQRKAVAGIPNRMDYRLELGVSLICYGGNEDDQASIAEGRDILKRVAAGEWLDHRNTDAIDMKNAAILINEDPDRVCAYSRDGYEDMDKDKIEK